MQRMPLRMLLASVALLASFASQATNYALLVGVGEYKSKDIASLAGPVNDADSMAALLMKHWGFPEDNTEVLKNNQATKENILNKLAQITRKARPGDQVVFYFSGHGTSAGDKANNKQLNLPHGTGAIMPYDAVLKGKPGQIRDSLIVGRFDLRKHFKSLDDKGVATTAIVDSCFSSFLTRTLDSKAKDLPERYALIDIPSKGLFDGEELEALNEDELSHPQSINNYPYSHVVTLTASSDSEKAKDIPEEYLGAFPTHDTQEHGAFTDAMLRVLKWQAESRVGAIDPATLHKMVRVFVSKRGYGHTPQLWPRYPSSELQPFFSSGMSTRAVSTDALQDFLSSDFTSDMVSHPDDSSKLHVSVDGRHARLLRKLQGLPGVEVVDRDADLLFSLDGPLLTIKNQTGDVILRRSGDSYMTTRCPDITCNDDNPDPFLMEFIENRLLLKRLQSGIDKHRDGLVDLSVQSNNVEDSAFRKHQSLTFKLRSEISGKLLMLDVMGDGQVAVLYPAQGGEFGRTIGAGEVITGFETCVCQVDESDSIVALIFMDQSKLIQDFMLRETVPINSSLMNDLMNAVNNSAVSFAGGYTEMYSVGDGNRVGVNRVCVDVCKDF